MRNLGQMEDERRKREALKLCLSALERADPEGWAFAAETLRNSSVQMDSGTWQALHDIGLATSSKRDIDNALRDYARRRRDLVDRIRESHAKLLQLVERELAGEVLKGDGE